MIYDIYLWDIVIIDLLNMFHTVHERARVQAINFLLLEMKRTVKRNIHLKFA